MTPSFASIPWATWRPKLLEQLPAYDRHTLAADLVAGLTVGVVALPLAMAFGIASGATPQAGIYTAIVGGFLVALLGGSSIQISGPTGAFVVIVSGIIAAHGISGLLMVTMMAGVILVLLAITGLATFVVGEQLLPGEERLIEATGPDCEPGTPVTATLDPLDLIDERNERDNSVTRRCPSDRAS